MAEILTPQNGNQDDSEAKANQHSVNSEERQALHDEATSSEESNGGSLSHKLSGDFNQRELLTEERGPMERESKTRSDELNCRHIFPEIVGKSPLMNKLLAKVHKAAVSDSPVLISGESGTGKELIAAALHRLSKRAARRFIAINCSAIPENLLESELFGYEKGAFTGASQRRAGLFEEANGGTIFLDEIGDMPQSLQVKLLRVLQDKNFTPIGSNRMQRSDVRIIAATNINLQDAVQEKRFRLDLFFRLNVLPVYVPPLRERGDDIEMLIDYFLEIMNKRYPALRPCFLSQEAVRIVKTYSWPGNVRELQNMIERVVVMVESGQILPKDLPEEILENYLKRVSQSNSIPQKSLAEKERKSWETEDLVAPTNEQLVKHGAGEPLSVEEEGDREVFDDFKLPESGIDLTTMIEGLENRCIMQALERTQYNKNQAARLLGINRTTLVERIKKRNLIALNLPSREL